MDLAGWLPATKTYHDSSGKRKRKRVSSHEQGVMPKRIERRGRERIGAAEAVSTLSLPLRYASLASPSKEGP